MFAAPFFFPIVSLWSRMPKNEIVKIINYTQIVRPLYFQRIVFHGVDVMVSVNFDFFSLEKPHEDRETEHLKALTKYDNFSAIADHIKTTGHNIKWDNFDILASGGTDYHCIFISFLLSFDRQFQFEMSLSLLQIISV